MIMEVGIGSFFVLILRRDKVMVKRVAVKYQTRLYAFSCLRFTMCEMMKNNRVKSSSINITCWEHRKND